jgi:hypothetical protein
LPELPHRAVDAMTSTGDPVPPVHPVTAALVAQRTDDVQLKIADGITTFAGSISLQPRMEPVADDGLHHSGGELAAGQLQAHHLSARTRPLR